MYLGCTITPDGKCNTEIKKRIGQSKTTFNSMKCIFTNSKISIRTKIHAMKAYIWSILLYGCECWTLTKDTERRLEAVEMWYIRRIMKVSWTKRKTNEEVMEMAEYKRSLLNTIRKRQLKFFGHVNRADGLEKLLLSGKICGKKSRGKQRTKFTDSLNAFATNNKGTKNELIRRTEKRDEWRAMIVDVCKTRP